MGALSITPKYATPSDKRRFSVTLTSLIVHANSKTGSFYIRRYRSHSILNKKLPLVYPRIISHSWHQVKIAPHQTNKGGGPLNQLGGGGDFIAPRNVISFDTPTLRVIYTYRPNTVINHSGTHRSATPHIHMIHIEKKHLNVIKNLTL